MYVQITLKSLLFLLLSQSGDLSWSNFHGHSPPSTDSRREVVNYWSKCALSTGRPSLPRLSLPRNNVVRLTDPCYEEGQSVNSDNGSISKKILLESKFIMQNVDMGNAYSCLKNGVFITTKFDGYENLHTTLWVAVATKISIWPLPVWGRVTKRCSTFVWIVISMIAFVSEYTKHHGNFSV